MGSRFHPRAYARMAMLRHRVSAWCAGPVAAAWVMARRARYRRTGRALNERERAAMSLYFDPPLLAAVRLALVERITDPPGAGLARRLGFRGVRGLAGVRGMAF